MDTVPVDIATDLPEAWTGTQVVVLGCVGSFVVCHTIQRGNAQGDPIQPYIYIYIYMYTYIYVYIYIYMNIYVYIFAVCSKINCVNGEGHPLQSRPEALNFKAPPLNPRPSTSRILLQ